MSNFKKMKRKSGGRVAYSGGASNVAKEAAEKNKGGAVDCGAIEGRKSGGRIKKARGGGVGADNHPFSSAYRSSSEAK